MARSPSRRAGIGQADAAAAIALYGSERKAAAALGVGRSTLNDIMRGVTGAGRKVVGAIESLAPEQRERVRQTSASLSAGRSGQALVQAARQLARDERRSAGSTARLADERQRRQAEVGLDAQGNALERRDSQGRRIAPGQEESYQRLFDLWGTGDLDETRYPGVRNYILTHASVIAETEIEDYDDDGDTDYDEE